MSQRQRQLDERELLNTAVLRLSFGMAIVEMSILSPDQQS